MDKEIQVHRKFKKHYKKRIDKESTRKEIGKRIELFLNDRQNAKLRDHQLTGDKKGYRAFSVSVDIRIIYKEDGDVYLFLDIGTHNQVY